MNIHKLHFISNETENTSHEACIEAACQAGVKWVQLRIKNKSFEECLSIAKRVKQICDAHSAVLIINDYATIAKEVNAHGLHLGKEDMNPENARIFLGKEFIIGGTANTFEDVVRLNAAEVNYIGLGPYRYTPTKEKLSPLLGLSGYEVILKKATTEKLNIPILAIGGIGMEDIAGLLSVGVHGVAVSTLITNSINKPELIQAFNTKVNSYA